SYLALSGAVFAAPVLRLTNTVISASANAGASPAAQTVGAYNIGDGSLSLSVGVPAPWLTVSVGPPTTCTTGACFMLQFAMNTAKLSSGRYTTEVTVSDPAAVDAPQVVAVTVPVGPAEPVVVQQWLKPGETRDVLFGSGSCLGRSCPVGSAKTDDGGKWLSVSFSYSTFGSFHNYMDYIHFAPPADMS